MFFKFAIINLFRGFDCIPLKYIKEKISQLKRENNYIEAERILLQYIDMKETAARILKGPVLPWAYEQLSIIYKKMKNQEKD
jgi:hypothetical protein